MIPTAEDVRQSTLFVRAADRALRDRHSEEARAARDFAEYVRAEEEWKQFGPQRARQPGRCQGADSEWSADESDEEEAQLEARLTKLRVGRDEEETKLEARLTLLRAGREARRRRRRAM